MLQNIIKNLLHLAFVNLYWTRIIIVTIVFLKWTCRKWDTVFVIKLNVCTRCHFCGVIPVYIYWLVMYKFSLLLCVWSLAKMLIFFCDKRMRYNVLHLPINLSHSAQVCCGKRWILQQFMEKYSDTSYSKSRLFNHNIGWNTSPLQPSWQKHLNEWSFYSWESYFFLSLALGTSG